MRLHMLRAIAVLLNLILPLFGFSAVVARDWTERAGVDGWMYRTPHGPPRLAIGRYMRPTTDLAGAGLSGYSRTERTGHALDEYRRLRE